MQAEAVRQFYLGVAGIQMWYARSPLPGAAPSPEYDFDAGEPDSVERQSTVATVPSVSKPDPDRSARSRDKIAHLQSLMSTVEPPSRKLKVPVAPDPAPQPVNETEDAAELPPEHEASGEQPDGPAPQLFDAPRLCLQAWKGRRVVLVAHISEESSFSLQEKLALNILRSLDELAPASLGTVHWPLFNNLKISLNSSDHLVDALRTCLGNVSDRVVIVLGETGSWLDEGLLRAPDIVFPGTLAKLASDPPLKRDLWRLIRPVSAK